MFELSMVQMLAHSRKGCISWGLGFPKVNPPPPPSRKARWVVNELGLGTVDVHTLYRSSSSSCSCSCSCSSSMWYLLPEIAVRSMGFGLVVGFRGTPLCSPPTTPPGARVYPIPAVGNLRWGLEVGGLGGGTCTWVLSYRLGFIL